MLLNCGVGEDSRDCQEIKPVNPKGNQSWIFIGRTDAKAESWIFWPADVKNWLIGRDPDAGKDWRQEEKGTPEDEMVGWHLWLNGHGFEKAPGDDEGQQSLACCCPWGHKESDKAEQLDSNNQLITRPILKDICEQNEVIHMWSLEGSWAQEFWLHGMWSVLFSWNKDISLFTIQKVSEPFRLGLLRGLQPPALFLP